jgi:hypothetical protein
LGSVGKRKRRVGDRVAIRGGLDEGFFRDR